MTDELELWNQQPWETDASSAAFQSWLLQAERPRSLDRAFRAESGRRLRASDTGRRWYHEQDETDRRIKGASSTAR